MRTDRIISISSAALALAAATGAPAVATAQQLSPAGTAAPGSAAIRYGSSVKLGDGTARSYVVLDATGKNPIEIGVALDERALENLPSAGSGHHDGAGMTHEYLFDLPAQLTTPFRFIELNWNPAGHEPPGVYEGAPHFDFHFYTITRAERDAIVPTDPRYAEKANRLPADEFVPPFNKPLGPPGAKPADVAVPKMGVHWVDLRSHELQGLLGNPAAHKPFTATFIHGSWDGRYHFWEPMITRAHMLEKKSASDPKVRDEIIPIPVPSKYQAPGYYPNAYRITWDAAAREYRIALTGLEKRG